MSSRPAWSTKASSMTARNCFSVTQRNPITQKKEKQKKGGKKKKKRKEKKRKKERKEKSKIITNFPQGILTVLNFMSVVWGPACWGICSRPVPHSKQVPEKINHTEISISYKADWPIRSGYLLALITFVTSLSLSTLATRLSTFLSWAGYMLPLWGSGQE